jgi:hypothetical protein
MPQGDLFNDDNNNDLERKADSLGGFDEDLELEAELEAQGGRVYIPDTSRIADDHPLLSRSKTYYPPTYTTDNFWSGAYNRKTKYDYNNSYKFQPVKSTSEYLRSNSYWGNGYYQSYSTTTTQVLAHEQLHETLKELNKTINLTSNSIDGQEKTMKVKFSNGLQINDFESDTLYVNPNVMMNGADAKSGDEYYTALDAMNGQAMLCSFMKKQIHPVANIEYKNCEEWSPRNIFATDIQQSASKEVGHKWPGFSSYISSQMDTFGVSKDVIEQGLQKEEVKLDDICEALCYNHLSGNRIDYNLLPINFQLKMEEAENIFTKMIAEPCSDQARFAKSQNIWKAIQDLFKDDVPPSEQDQQQSQGMFSIPSTGDNQNQSQDNQGQPQQDQRPQNGVKVDKNPSEKDRRFTGDNSYNNHAQIDGDLVFNQLDHEKKLKERLKNLDDSIKSDLKDNAELHESTTFRLMVPPVNAEEISQYNKFVKSNKRSIDSLKNALMFHNNTATIPNYGLTDGDLDEHAFYKMHFGEYERLFERKETLSEKGYHVTLVIDQSGSMGGSRITEARELCILFSEALKYLRATEHSIYGFETSDINTWVYKDKQYDKHEALIKADSHGGTAMGHHLAVIGDKVITQYPEFKNKFMFVLTDGQPTHGGKTMNSTQFTAHMIQKLKQKGIQVYGIGMCNGFSENEGKELFGEGNFTVINNVKDSLFVLVNKMRKFLQKASKA